MAGARVVIFGAGDIAALAGAYLRDDSPHEVVAHCVDEAYRTADAFEGLPLVAFERVVERFPPASHAFFVAMSYAKLNRARAERCAMLRALGYRLVSYVSSRATVFGDLAHGDNCFVLEDNTIQPFAKLGNNVTLWSGNHIGHHAVIEDDVFVASHVVVSGGVRIGRGSFVGVNATIRDHVTVGAECVIGAAALVLEDQADHGVLAPRGTERSSVPATRLRRI